LFVTTPINRQRSVGVATVFTHRIHRAPDANLALRVFSTTGSKLVCPVEVAPYSPLN
jgi:hypothetical protein